MARKKIIKLCRCGNQVSYRANKWCDECIKNRVYNPKPKNVIDAKTDKTRRKMLIRVRGHKCEVCNNYEWINNPIPLELDHIDGDSDNNIEGNLRLLCPNCHAQTEFYKGANKGNSSRQITRRLRYANGQTY